MTIVRASPTQLTQAELLLQEYYAALHVVQRDSPEDLITYLSDPHFGLWLAYDGEAPAGCVALRPLASLPLAAECKRLYVQPQLRGRGLASGLLQAMETYARDAGYTSIYLDSMDDLHDALRLYRSRGYEPCERYNNNPQATAFLRKHLNSGASASP